MYKTWDKHKRQWKMKPLGIHKDIGVVIVDEAHVACASEMVKSLFYFEPKLTIALTATPYRKDGLDKVLDLYFGKHKIVRISESKFYVYVFKTFFKPQNVKNSCGKKDWSKVISSISDDKERNQKIVKLVQYFHQKNTILILTKLTRHVNTLIQMLNENGIKTTRMCGNDKEYDKECSVLIATFSKLGVGFDDTRFNCLLLACDVEQVEQYAGRLREGDKDRIIIDMVDQDYNCQNHLKKRKEWYLSRNGIITSFEKSCPDFFYTSITTDENDDETNEPIEYKRLAK